MTASSTVPASVAIRNEFQRLYGHLETVYADEKVAKPAAFAEWSDGKWTRWLYREVENELTKTARQLFPHAAKITDHANQAMREIIATAPMTHESDWNVSTASIPLSDGNWSVSFEPGKVGTIVPTNKEHRMLNRFPVSKADLLRADSEFDASLLRGYLIDWFQVMHEGSINNSIAHGLQKLLGQALAGNPESIIMLWIGDGQNGKSGALKLVKAAVGDYATPMNVDDYVISRGHSTHPEGLLCLRTARLGFIGELESPNTMLAGGQLKSHTGGDGFKARGMGQASQEMTSNVSFIVFGNHDPRIDDTSYGMERRVKYIPFDNMIPTERMVNKNDFKRIVESEKHIMLHWMLEGAKLWEKEGLGDLGLIDIATKNYMSEEDVIAEVFHDYVMHSTGKKVKAKDLHKAMDMDGKLPKGCGTWRSFAKHIRKRARAIGFDMTPKGGRGEVEIYDHMFLPKKAPDDRNGNNNTSNNTSTATNAKPMSVEEAKADLLEKIKATE